MIEVVDHRESWPARFAEVRDACVAALAAAGVRLLAIEHVGSTAVPGLAAKPVIDVDVAVEADAVAGAVAALASIGFRPLGELGIPGRWAFDPPERFADTHVYVLVAGSTALRNHLGVRDVLRADAALRAEYDAVKRRSAASGADIDRYLADKGEVLARILERAGLGVAEREEIAAANRAIAERGARG